MNYLKKVSLITMVLLFLVGACEQVNEFESPDSSPLKSGVAMAMDSNTPLTFELFAGQDLDVGEVQVWNDDQYLYVKYLVDVEGWCLTETHLHVAGSPEEIPQKNGNPVPGKFDYKGEHECETDVMYAIDLAANEWDCDDKVYIAAHAVVENCCECEDPIEELYLADCGIISADGQGTELFKVELDEVNQEANLTSLVVMPADFYDQVAALAATPDGQKIYAIDRASKRLGVYDVGTGVFSEIGVIAGLAPFVVQAAFSPDGKLYVSSNDEDNLYVIDIATPKVDETIKLNDIDMKGADIIFAASGTLYLYTNGGKHGLYKIDDLTAAQPISPVWIGTPAEALYFTGLAIRDAGTGNLVASDRLSPIYTISTADGSNILTYATMKDGSSYTVGYGDMTVGNLCELPWTETAWGAGNDFPEENDFPGKNWATYFTYEIQCCNEWIVYGSNLNGGTDPEDDAIYAIDLNAQQTRTLVYNPKDPINSNQSYPNGNAYDPVNQRIYFGTNDGKLYYHQLGSETHVQVASGGFGTIACGAWYDGKYYYVQNSTSKLYEVTITDDVATRTQIGNVPTSNGYGDIVFDPDNPGIIIGSAGVPPVWYVYDIVAGSGSVLTRTGGPNKHLQLAYASNGKLYAVEALSGQFYTVDYSIGENTVTLTEDWNSGFPFTDLASGPQCW